ncbi:MAG: glutathione-disulfide reductase [Pseudomonadota bacterium]
MSTHYDLIAIGGGSAGLAVAEQAAALGRRVALVEQARLGGTCVNAGCVPKKVMWNAAQALTAVRHAGEHAITAAAATLDWATLVARREAYVAGINRYWDEYVMDRRITRIAGRAHFTDARGIEVDGARYTADHIVIATGSAPIVPAVPGAELGITSDGFFALDQQPRRVAVIGGGYIGVELAGVLQALDATVTLVTLETRVLAAFDPMLGDRLAAQMAADGIALRTGFQVSRLQRGPRGIDVVGTDGTILTGYDTVIWAVGRRANSADLGLEAAGVAVGRNGVISVDALDRTGVAGIHAIGDVTGRVPLTPVAVAAGRRLARRLFGDCPDCCMDYTQVPTVVFAHPPVASVGLSEPQAWVRHGDAVTVYETAFTPMQAALGGRAAVTAMKLVCVGAAERIVGCHVIGAAADEILQGFAVALRMGATKADFDGTVAIHPTSAEELVTMKQGRPVHPDIRAGTAAAA